MADADVDMEIVDSGSGVNNFFTRSLYATLQEGTYFSLSQQTISALDLLPKLKADGTTDQAAQALITSRSSTTIHSVLNKCRTTGGQRLLTLWLKNPLKNVDKINSRLEIVHHLSENAQLRSLCHDEVLRKIPDLLRIAYKLEKEKCTINDLIKVYNSTKLTADLYEAYENQKIYSPELTPDSVEQLFLSTKTSTDNLKDFLKIIEDTIDLENIDPSGDYMVKPEVDDDIGKVTIDINRLTKEAKTVLDYAARDLNLEAGKSIKLETDNDKGFGLRVTKQNEQSIRGNTDYHQLSTVKKDGYRFSTDRLDRLSAKYVSAKEEYRSLARLIIENIIDQAVMFSNEVLDISMSLSLIDVFVGMATAAMQNNYVKPLMFDSDTGRIELERMRHPCIEQQPDIVNYVPNDLILSKDEKKFYIITGPNMGGKSTFIKSVAVNVIMAQCGSLVPADEAKISIVDNVFTRVGAGDRQMEGISTFMEEMLDMAKILNEASENSLVIIDELGRGTSTFDGFGLAWSISRQLSTKIKCYTLFATHFHEMTELENEVASVGNLHVKALCSEDKLTMLYTICDGVCDESYGIEVAKYTRFPEHVTEAAKEKLRQLEELPCFSSKQELRVFVKSCVDQIAVRDGAK